jgi:arylsulfatase A-like enzyme
MAWANGGTMSFATAADVPDPRPAEPETFGPPRDPRVAEWSEAVWRFCRYTYSRQVEMVDAQIGRVFDAVAQRPDAGNALSVMVADHGDGIGCHGNISKGYLEDESMRVPAMAATAPLTAMGKDKKDKDDPPD